MFRHRSYLVAAILLLATAAPALAQNTVSFTLTATPNASGQVVPDLAWSTSPPAVSCAASGNWSGTKAASGAETQPATSSSKSYTIQCTWPGDSIATFTWTPATSNENATPYTNPAITRIKYTFGPTAPTATTDCATAVPTVVCVDVDDSTATRPNMKTVTGITQTGTLRAMAMHVNAMGVPGSASNVATKVFTGNVGVTQNVVLTFPNGPSDFAAN